MSYRWVEHTAELELCIEAANEAAVFEDALRALGELFADGLSGAAVARDVDVTACDRAALLGRWLEELVFLAETEDLVSERTTAFELAAGRLSASVEGRRGEPRHLVKGVTYHRLAFEPCADGYRATVVLDV